MTDQELIDLVASLAAKHDRFAAENAAGFAALREVQTRTEMQMAVTDAQLARTDKKFKTMQTMLDGISKNQGSVAEEFFYASLKSKPSVGDITFDRVTPNFIVGRKGRESEFDVVMINGNSAAIVEVKYKAHVNDLEHVHKQIKRLRTECPEYKNYALYGGIAGLSVPNDVSKAAKAQGCLCLNAKVRCFKPSLRE
jgi:hypothetical protein